MSDQKVEAFNEREGAFAPRSPRKYPKPDTRREVGRGIDIVHFLPDGQLDWWLTYGQQTD